MWLLVACGDDAAAAVAAAVLDEYERSEKHAPTYMLRQIPQLSHQSRYLLPPKRKRRRQVYFRVDHATVRLDAACHGACE